ncbi:MAG: TonB-dependent receptor [Xanthomonadaceae bacterium]|nr:TonB-dependent receptor [Xanthomonadaceae bacterium]
MNLSADGRLRLAARFAFFVGVGSLSGQVLAEGVEVAQADSPAAVETAPTNEAPGKVKQLGSVQVTGSRIKSPNLTSNAPVTVIGKEELKFQGTTRVEDLLNNIPAAFAGQGGNLSNGADGTATVDLRNLGPARTLVLIDGKRVQPGVPGDTAADLNFIPAQLIQSVEILTGGASAIYGSDAISGVVNFTMAKDFEGVRVDYQRSGYQHTNNNSVGQIVETRGFPTPDKNQFDGQGHQLSITLGVNSADGKGNATVYASYLQLDPVTQDRRDFSACTFNNLGSSNYACAGSGTTFPSQLFVFDPDTFEFLGSFTPDPTRDGLRPYVGARDAFNFAPFNFYQRNQERYGLGSFAHYKFNDAVDVYTQLMFNDTRTNAVIAPSGIFGLTVNVTPDNPFLTPGQRTDLFAGGQDSLDVTILRRNVEGGGRDDNLRNTAYRAVFGVKGDFAKAWSYDTSIQYGTTIFSEIYRNEFSLSRVANALDVVALDDGTVVCRVTAADPTNPCVPFNPFSPNRQSPEAIEYLQVPGLQNGQTTQQVATGSISGNLGEYGLTSPFAKSGVGVAFGGEYRRESGRLDTDVSFQTGDLAGQGAPTLPISGAFSVKELFGEIRVPLVQGLPGIHELGFSAGYRFSDYTQTSSTDTYKIDGEWAPVPDIRFRGGYNRAVRAPAIGEIVDPTRVGLNGNFDPCEGSIDPETGIVSGGGTRAQCANDPLIAANPDLYGNIIENLAGQYNAQLGTSPGLEAEKADTYTGGFVFTPTFVKNLSVSIDYYDIKVDGFIGGYGYQTIIDACYERGALCDLIRRDPNPGASFGSLWIGNNGFVVNTTQNTGSLTSTGVDVSLNYRMRLAELGLSNRSGSLIFDLQGTRVIEQNVTPIPGDPTSTYSCAGNYGVQCGVPVPRWRHRFRTTYTVPTPLDSVLTVSSAWRYIGHVTEDGAGGPNDLNRRLGAESYVDLSAALQFSGAYTFRVGVQNLFDNDPPILSQTVSPGVLVNGNTFPQVYDSLGRYLYANIVLDF